MRPDGGAFGDARCDRFHSEFVDRAKLKCGVSAWAARCKLSSARAFADCGAGGMFLLMNGGGQKLFFDDPDTPPGTARFTADETGVFVLWRGGLPVWQFCMVVDSCIMVPAAALTDPTITLFFDCGRAIEC